MFQVAAYGRLGGDPRSIDTSSGKAMAVASIAVDVAERGTEDPEPEWLGVVAFGGLADKLLQHAKGETVSVSGRVQRRRYQDRNGNERVQLEVIADALVSARTVRPGANRRQAAAGSGRNATGDLDAVAGGRGDAGGAAGGRAPATAGPSDDFDDDIPW